MYGKKDRFHYKRLLRENTVKIVATLGPASSSKQMLQNLISAGVDVFRLNFSHGSHDEKRELTKRIREVDPYVGILADIQGPKIRVGLFAEDKAYNLSVGQEVKVYEKEILGNDKEFSVPLPGFLESMKQNDYFFVNDGLIKIRVLKKLKDYLLCEVLQGGAISNRKGLNLPTGELRFKVPTEKDIKDIELIAELDPEYIAVSFVERAEQVLEVRKLLENYGNDKIKIISKIERPVALENLDSILEVSDGLMVARGDLGVEIDPDQVPIWQKRMAFECNKQGKPCIIATQLLESMISSAVPTRAEANDVYNACVDGADAVMLSAETAVGKYPIQTVLQMNKIAITANENMPVRDPNAYDSNRLTHTQIIGHSIYALAAEMEELNFRGKILVITRGGIGAKMIAKYRPILPIIAITPHARTAREMQLVWGVQPVHIDEAGFYELDAEDIIEKSVKLTVEKGFLDENEHVIILVVSKKFKRRGNLVGLYYVGEILEGNSQE